MSLFVPSKKTVRYQRNYSDIRPADTSGLVLTGNNQIHSVSTTYTNVFSSTDFDSYFLRLAFSNSGANGALTDQLCHLYIGGSGSEQPLIRSILTGWSGRLVDGVITKTYEFPVYIPAGSRISAQLQTLIASDTVQLFAELRGGAEPDWAGAGVETIGANIATSNGTTVTLGGASEGTFTAVGTSSVAEWRYLQPMFGGALADTTLTAGGFAADVGVGGAVYQELSDFVFQATNTESISNFNSTGRYCTVPVGTTVQIRGQSSTAAAEPLDCCIYGVY